LLPVTGATQQHVSEKGEKIAIVMGNGKCFNSWNKENRRTLLIPTYVQKASHDVYKSEMTCIEKKMCPLSLLIQTQGDIEHSVCACAEMHQKRENPGQP